MAEEMGERGILLETALDSEGKRHAEDEEKGGEYHVDVGHEVFVGVGVIGPARETFHTREIVDEDHQQHGEAAKDVDGEDAIVGDGIA